MPKSDRDAAEQAPPKRLRLLPLRRRLGLRVLPNLVTLVAMLCGFISLLRASNGDYTGAAFLLLIAAILDGLDGKIARIANAESKIGQQFDTLADMVSFGVAPVFLLYHWAAPQLAGLAIIAACIYLCCAGFRLARFNLGGQEQSGPFYRGLASPAAACMVSSLVWMQSLTPTAASPAPVLLVATCLMAVLGGMLMVSSIPYYKFSRLRNASGENETLLTLVFAGAVFGLLAYDPPLGTALLAGGYVISGPARLTILRLLRLLQGRGKSREDSAADSGGRRDRAG